jgi:hypothetical protein
MRSISLGHLRKVCRWALPPLLTLFFAGCGDSQIKTYRVAKEDNTPKIPTAANTQDPHEHAQPLHSAVPTPKLSWTLPAGWKELPPDGMRKANFQVTGENGKMAQVMIIPLPGASNIEPESVNMWREELGLTALSKDDVTAQAQSVDVGDAKGHLWEMATEEPKPDQKFKTRTLGAIAEREGILWFIKMTGEDGLVAAQKPVFVSFLKSLSFQKAEPAQLASAEAPVSANSRKVPPAADAPKWQVPANWQEKAPGPMVTTAYNVSGPDGAADVTVIKLPGSAGGLVGNVNRWRGQLGLAPLADAEARSSAEKLEVDGKKDSYMIDIKGTNARTGKPARMVAVGVPRGGETWFYKLMGDEGEVAREKDAFLKFIVSAY